MSVPKAGRLLASLAGLLLLAGPALLAQGRSTLQIGVGPMAVLYQGDLDEEGQFPSVNAGGNLSIQFDGPRFISPQLNVGVAKVTAQDRDLMQMDGRPNTFVSTRYFYGSLMLRARFRRFMRFRPHLAVGIGFLGFQPEDRQGRELESQVDTRAPGESINTTSGMFPIGLGFTHAINEFVAIGVDYQWQHLFTDHLDNIGELGLDEGNDKLHQISLSLYLKPGYKKDPGRSGR